MTPNLVLLHRAATHADECRFILPRLRLDGRPFDAPHRLEVACWCALRGALASHPGHRVEVRRACPPRWLSYLDHALALPDWFDSRSEATPDLLAGWNAASTLSWELPDGRAFRGWDRSRDVWAAAS